MLRTLIVPLEWLATFLAIASPVIIIHWLCDALDAQAVKGFVDFLKPFVEPFNQTLTTILKPIPSFPMPFFKINTQPLLVLPTTIDFSFTKPITVMKHTVSPVQGVLGILMTIGFFMLNVIIQILKAGEKKIEVTKNTMRMNQALKESRLAQVAQSKKIVTDKDIVVYVEYGFLDCPTGATYFETGYSRFGGNSLQSNPDCLIVQFNTVDEALNYVKSSVSLLGQYYETLKPMDPRPAFRICVAAFHTSTGNPDKFEFCRLMKGYAGPNQTILTHDSKLILEANEKLGNFNIETMGYYNIYGKNTELHALK